MDHIDHERAALKLRYLPFNYPAAAWHMREGNRKINERLDREGLRGRAMSPASSCDYVMADA